VEAFPVKLFGTPSDRLRLAGLVGGLIVLKAWLIQAAGFDLHYEEAQYWTWSQHLDWSYYSKGPLTAWVIALCTALFGDGEWQVRLGAWLAHGAFLALAYAFARDVWQDRRAGWWAVVLLLTTPLYFTLGLAMTTDVLLFVFWTWALWAAYRAIYRGRPRAWYELGAAVGLGALAKLSIGLLPFFVGLTVLFSPTQRRHLKAPQLWGGVLIMAAIMSPMVWWNAQHHWVMLHHEMGHIEATTWSLIRALRFTAGQALILSPVVVAVAATVLYRPPRQPPLRLLWVVSLACVAFFIVKSVSAKVQINWPAPAYIGLFILFAGHAARLTGGRRRLLLAGVASSLVLLVMAYFPAAIGLAGNRDPFKDTKLWQDPIHELSRTAAPYHPAFVVTDSYKLSSELAFYWPGRPPAYVTGSRGRRFNQFDLWPSINREAGRTGLYVATNPSLPAVLGRAFAACTALTPVPARAADGSVVRTLYGYVCTDYRPIPWPTPATY
jgi:4-amino-4-deoxy-L-arabinose transferase-like glycosyltransferase